MTQEQFNSVTQWQRETFPDATAWSKFCHLHQEMDELNKVLFFPSHDAVKRLEFADCFLLLFGCAAASGMSYRDIVNAIDEKMVINRKRKWGKPDGNGVVNHIEDDRS